MSHNEKLKTLGDKDNTNLYVSNIPMDNNFNEHVCIRYTPWRVGL